MPALAITMSSLGMPFDATRSEIADAALFSSALSM